MSRPKKTLGGLPEGWKEALLAMYREGASDVEVRAELGISNDLFYRWLNDEPEFSETIKKGRELSEAWWSKLGRQGASGQHEINPTTWIFNMKNRFSWRDRHEVTAQVDQTHRVISSEPMTEEDWVATYCQGDK